MDQPTGSAEATIKEDAELPVFDEGPNPADERQRVSALEQAKQEVLFPNPVIGTGQTILMIPVHNELQN